MSTYKRALELMGARGPESLELIKFTMLGCFEKLLRRAKAGEAEAAGLLIDMMRSETTKLLSACGDEPEKFAALAATRSSWPGLITANSDTQAWQDAIKNRLRLGTKATVAYKPGRRPWSSATPEIAIALRLVNQLERFRQPRVKPSPTYRTIARDARKLPPLTKATSAQWWKVGLACMIEDPSIGPRYEDATDFAHYKRKLKNNDDGKSVGLTRSDIRKEIRKKMKQAFRTLAHNGG